MLSGFLLNRADEAPQSAAYKTPESQSSVLAASPSGHNVAHSSGVNDMNLELDSTMGSSLMTRINIYQGVGRNSYGHGHQMGLGELLAGDILSTKTPGLENVHASEEK